MNDGLFSTSLIFDWHAAAQTLAYTLLLVLLAFVLLQFALARSKDRTFLGISGSSLRITLFIGLTMVAIVPAAALGVLLSEHSAHSRHERMEQRIEETAASVAFAVDRFVDKHLTGIKGAAATINADAQFDPETLTDTMMRFHSLYGEFLTMLCTDDVGDIVAATSVLRGTLEPFSDPTGFNVADREYFKMPMATGFPYVSQAFRGRGLGSDPIVGISAPLKAADGRRLGIVEASLNLSSFAAIDEERPKIDGSALLIVDEQDRVIFASDSTDYAYLEDLSLNPMVTNSRSARASNAYEFSLDVDDRNRPYLAAYAETELKWRTFIRAPIDPVAQEMLGDYLVGAALLGVTAALSMLLAWALVHRLSIVISNINENVARFTLDKEGSTVEVPDDVPEEFLPVFESMRQRSRQMRVAYRRLQRSIDAGVNLRKELTQAIALKEVEIAERTEELQKANEKLNSENKTDPLTGIANRRQFDEFEQRIWRLGIRDSVPIAAIMLDIDFFKIYNDTLGHQQGDDCLKQVAEVLHGCATRPLDLVARYGGEEFVVVLGGATVADALIVAERMRAAVEGLDMDHPGSPHKVVSVSAGAASMVPQEHIDPSALIKAADESLYYAKAAGRNCIVFRRDEEYVTYESQQHRLDTTNVIALLAGSQPTRKRN